MSNLEFKTIGINSKARPYSKNKNFLRRQGVRVQCPICKTGNNQCHIFKSVWGLYLHFTKQHPNADENQQAELGEIMKSQAQKKGKTERK